MKKIILTVSVIAIIAMLGLCLAACNNATTQGQLANLLSDHNHEAFEYEVKACNYYGEVLENYPYSSGVYTVTLDAYNAGATVENFGNATLSNVQKGVLVLGKLTIGDAQYDTGCYFNLIGGSSYMVPAYTYRVHTVGSTETFRLQGAYDGATLNFERWINGEKSVGSVSTKSTYFDNNEFHQSLRTITTFSSNFSFSFATPIISSTEATFATLTATISSTANIKTPYTENVEEYAEKGINCYKMFLSRSTEVNGLYQTLYYATENITDDGWSLKNVLVRIEEPFKLNDEICKMVYELKSATLS